MRPFRVPLHPVVPLWFAGAGALALGAVLLWWLEHVSRMR